MSAEPVEFVADGITYRLTHQRLAHSLTGMTPASWALLENLVDTAEGRTRRAPELETLDAIAPLARHRLAGSAGATSAGHAVVIRVRSIYDGLADRLAEMRAAQGADRPPLLDAVDQGNMSRYFVTEEDK